ncbi:orotidine-5'-phosphate decarboxylase [Candidatus Parcubacteria bacterium]|nr:MAG: orotidine-5'-phosphate decarboxylase [Candidatus Parcubacteria bacterium]
MNMLEKYDRRVDAVNSLVCVGLDSDIELIPKSFLGKEFPQFEFNKHIIEATHDLVSAYKPNIAFYESRGDRGFRELKMTMDYLRERHPDIVTICDAKRGDTATTNVQYAKTLFDWFGFDAATVNPYMGHEPLAPFLGRKDKGCIVVCRTSNPGAPEIQDLKVGEKPLWQIVAEKVRDDWNANGNCLLVVGATYPEEMRILRNLVGDITFLIPGIGAQGGDIEAMVRAGLNSKKKGMIIASARGFIFAEDPRKEVLRAKEQINALR